MVYNDQVMNVITYIQTYVKPNTNQPNDINQNTNNIENNNNMIDNTNNEVADTNTQQQNFCTSKLLL